MSGKVQWGGKPPRDPERAEFRAAGKAWGHDALPGCIIPWGRCGDAPVRNSADALRFGLVIRANRVVGVIVQKCLPPAALGAQPPARKQYDVIHTFTGDRDLHVDTALAKRWKVEAVLGVLDWLRSDAVKQMTAAPEAAAWLTLEAT